MCHNSVLENEQIEKCVENGMPTKIINAIKQTMRKRMTTTDKQATQQQNEELNPKQNIKEMMERKQINNQKLPPPVSQVFVLKCPFGHGKVSTPQETTFSLATIPTTKDTNSKIEFLNNNTNNKNKNLNEQFPEKSQLRTTAENIKNLGVHSHDGNAKLLFNAKNIYNDDILAKSTLLTKALLHKMQQAFKCSKTYTLLTKTTQPAHLVVIGIVTFTLLAIWPELIVDNSDFSKEQLGNQSQHTSIPTVPRQKMSVKKHDMLVLIAYLSAFSTRFGAQIWMSFVSGIALYFSLPRHIFGQCQQVLFPLYFTMNAALSIVMLVLYVKFFINTWSMAECVQVGSLALSSTIELLVRLYMAPPLLILMHEKYKIEGSIGSGNEVGCLVLGDLIKCPHYQRIHKTFRRMHMTISIGNIITMASSCLQLYNIAGQLQISIVH